MTKLEEATETYVATIRATDIYENYVLQRDKVKKMPELKAKIDEFRRRNFELQNSEETEDLYDKVDAFEQEYAKFIENPLVRNFLDAELGFCRMMQKIYTDISDKIDFE